jgi:hypothetical protein
MRRQIDWVDVAIKAFPLKLARAGALKVRPLLAEPISSDQKANTLESNS